MRDWEELLNDLFKNSLSNKAEKSLRVQNHAKVK